METPLQKADRHIQENKQNVNERYRLRYHLMPEAGWMNDPNGFSFYGGKYHLFYQLHPYGSVWGPMHWGHATSEDLVRWEHAPVALAPDTDADGGGCFSGTAMEVEGRHVLMYTGLQLEGDGDDRKVHQVQCLAFGDGKSYEKSLQNPVIPKEKIPEGVVKADVRDPKLFERNGMYYCILGSKDLEQKGVFLLYRSADLMEWECMGTMDAADEVNGGVWECPDHFRMDGKDILLVSPQFKKPESLRYHNIHSTCARIGTLDLEKGRFLLEQEEEIDAGFDFYAPQTLEDGQGRRIMVAWMQMWERNMPSNEEKHGWAGAMTFPRILWMQDGRLHQLPVPEIESSRRNRYMAEAEFSGTWTQEPLRGNVSELLVEFETLEAEAFGVKLFAGQEEETVFRYDVKEEVLIFDRRRSGIVLRGSRKELAGSGVRRTQLKARNGKVTMRFLLDRTSVEAFLNGGEKAMTGTVYPSEGSDRMVLFAEGKVKVRLEKYDLIF
ncbi:glycoside hydrolase family 32 protein [Clostridiales bacterium F-3ap]|uniref:Sucrose-6-phosphate hydrolase n=2 Tax=Anaerotalea alkaliphila TaxID=2662126 RepID=A0A7X5KMS7_9FIRM|nr:glycoside hydrolase family 32 protein [Anaerotalea alkaliphila]